MLPHTTRCALFPYTTLFRSLPRWEAGEEATGNWGGSSTAVTTQTRHRDAAVRFAEWLHPSTDAGPAPGTASGAVPADPRSAERRAGRAGGGREERERLQRTAGR